MGLIIKPSEKKQINLAGTPINLDSVYARLEFGCRADGKTIEIATYISYNKERFKKSELIPTDIDTTNVTITLPEGVMQTVQSVHDLAKTEYESKGYIVEIDL